MAHHADIPSVDADIIDWIKGIRIVVACVYSSCMIIEYKWSSCWVQPLFHPVYLSVFLLLSLLKASLVSITLYLQGLQKRIQRAGGGGGHNCNYRLWLVCVCVCDTLKKSMPFVSVAPWDGMSGVGFNVIGCINLIPSVVACLPKAI